MICPLTGVNSSCDPDCAWYMKDEAKCAILVLAEAMRIESKKIKGA